MNQNFFTNCKVCHAEFTIENSRYDFVKCKNCELVFCREIFHMEKFTDMYNALYNSDDMRAYKRHSVTEYEQLKRGKVSIGFSRKKIISRLMAKHGKIVEIGSGIGLVGMYLRKFPDVEYTGIELDEESHNKAISLGINSINGDFSMLNSLPSNIETIMLWEVFEHLQDVSLFMALLQKKLKKGGSVILSIPNYDKRLNYEQNDSTISKIYQDPPPIHLNFFTKKSLETLFVTHGFTIGMLRVKRFPYLDFSDKALFRNVVKAIFGKYYGSTIYMKAVKS